MSAQPGESTVPPAPQGSPAPPVSGREATVAVINQWTKKFWEQGRALERQYEDYLVESEDFEQALVDAEGEWVERKEALEELLRSRGVAGNRDAALTLAKAAQEGGQGGGGEGGTVAAASNESAGFADDEVAAAARALADAARAKNELVAREPNPAIVTGFIDSGSTNCFAGAYELKIRLEHVTERLGLLLETFDEIIGGDASPDDPE